MDNFTPTGYWSFNCGRPRDFDFYVSWGNLTVQRNNLHYIRITLHFWNQIDGWKTKSKIFTPPNAPTSNPFTFYAEFHNSWCKGISGCAERYFGKQYKLATLIEIIYGGNGQAMIVDEYFYDSDSIDPNLRFCRTDPLNGTNDRQCLNELPEC